MRLKSGLVLVFFYTILEMTSARSAKNSVRSNSNRTHSCRLLELSLEEDLNMRKLEGSWYLTFKTAMENSILSYFTEIYDTRIRFKMNTEGGFDLNAAGSKFYGAWCPVGKGKAVLPDSDHPERMTMYFDTTIGRKIGMKPAWLLKTDYNNYAIIYSCWKEKQDGFCDSTNTYIIVLQRSPKPLTPTKLAEVKNAIKSACLDIRTLSPVYHYGYCIAPDFL